MRRPKPRNWYDIFCSRNLCYIILYIKSSSVKSTDTKKPVEFEEDISELGKALDQEDGGDTDDVLIEEITQQKEGWRHEYYVILGFFLVFMAFFLIIVAVLVYKLKKNKVSELNFNDLLPQNQKY